MHVRLNAEKCQGHLRCMAIAPGVFDSDEAGYGVLTSTGVVPEGLEAAVRRSAANCPEQAISVE